MSETIWDKTANELAKLAQRHRKVLVGYSGGKESRCILQLACRSFPEVLPYYLYYVPGLRSAQESLDYAKSRWGVDVIQRPHPLFFHDLRNSPYAINGYWQNLPDFDTEDIVQSLMEETGATLVVLGHKYRDGLHRKHLMSRQYKDSRYSHLCFPIREWNKPEVIGFLKANDIPVPEAYDDTSTSMNTSSANILWLWEKWPDDYEKFLQYFPDAAAVVARYQMFGIGREDR